MEKVLHRVLLRNRTARRFIIFIVILLFGSIDFITGYEFSFAVFYLIPIAIAAWYDNKKYVLISIFLSAATWLLADVSAGHVYSNLFILIWNTVVRIIFYTVVALLLYKIKQNWYAMKNMAMKDALTNLDNSRSFEMEYRILRKLSFRKNMKFAVGMIDLDGFKLINDKYGHAQGDQVLVQFAQLLKRSCRISDVVVRLGGDEFAIMLVDVNETEIENYNNRLRKLFQDSALKQNYSVNFSMGLALFNALPQNIELATQIADQLMYRAKQQGKAITLIEKVN